MPILKELKIGEAGDSNRKLVQTISFLLENTFIDFNGDFDSGERESQIFVSFFEKENNNYLFMETNNNTTGFLESGEEIVFRFKTLEEVLSFAETLAWNLGYFLQFGRTNVIFQKSNQNITLDFDDFDDNRKQWTCFKKSVPLVDFTNVTILNNSSYYSLETIESIKSKLRDINVDYSYLPLFIIKYIFKELNDEIEISSEAKEFLDDYQCSSCGFINRIMHGTFNKDKFNSSWFSYPREYNIDRYFIDRLFEFIDSFQKCQKDMIVYRGTENQLDSDSFISTSLSKDFSYKWAKGHKILIPKDSLYFTPLLLKKGINSECEVILLPGTFDYVPENDCYIYNGKDKSEVKTFFLHQLEKQKNEIILANKQDVQLFDDALMYGTSLIDFSNNKQMK